MNLQIFIAFSFSFALHLHRINALFYKLQVAHPHHAENSQNSHLKDLILVRTSNEIARQDFVYLFMTPPTNQFAHISMPALQILCYLRMAKIPFYTFSNQFLLASPTGKPQFAQINGQIFDDPKKIIEEIEKVEAEKNKKPKKVVEKSEKEIKMEEALDTIQNIIYADLLTSSRTKNYDGSFPLDGSSQLELWMKDEGLKEQMFLALTKMEANEDKENSETIGKHSHDKFGRSNLAKNELKFMEAYFNTKNRGSEEKDIFFVTHGRDFMHFHKMQMEVEENEEEEYEDTENELFEIVEVIKKKKKNESLKKPLLHLSTSGSQASNKLQQKHHQSEREGFEELMDKRVEERLAGEMAKLKISIVEFSKALSQKTIKIPLPKEKEKLKKKEQEEMKKQNETNKKIENFWDWEDIIQQAQHMKIGSEEGWGKLASSLKNLQLGKQIRQFEHKKLEECSEEELAEAFKHAFDVLAPIVRQFSDYEGFLFHKKATATEARLLAILSHLFTVSRNILKLGELMAYELRDVAVYKHNNVPFSLDEALITNRTHLPFDWIQKRIFLNENLRILSDYFEMRRGRLGLDVKTLKALRKRPWSLEGMEVVYQQKYTGPYPFKTNSMEWLPQWADENKWSEPQEIKEKPLNEEIAGPNHKILTEILSKIVYHFWENLKGKKEYEIGKETNYVACRKALMHIVASYLCKGSIKLEKGKDNAFKWAIFSMKEKDCSEWHLEQFYKLDEFKRQLLGPLFIPMKRIISQIVEETIGFEDKILGAIKKGMNAQEKGKKGKGKMDEPVEGNFMLDLF